MQTPGKTSLYFHIPFCKKKCPYCHFYSVYPKDSSIKSLSSCFLKQLESVKVQIASIYFGGGTPSLFGENIGVILEKIKRDHNIQDIEITLETNPEDVTREKIRLFKNAGINRISLGVESFNDEELKILGRNYTAPQAMRSIETIYEGGIENISIDLMYDLPFQTELSFEKSLDYALKMPISHLSLYNLTLEENTPFYKNKDKLKKTMPDSKLSLKLLKKAIEKFSAWHRYEISAFAKDKKVSYHNIGYWTGRPFLGFGPSAFSYFEGKRYQNVCNTEKYIALVQKDFSPVDFSEKLPYPENVCELLAINLRMLDGVDIEKFQEEKPLPKDTLLSIKKMLSSGLLEQEQNIIRLSEKGTLFYDTVAENLI